MKAKLLLTLIVTLCVSQLWAADIDAIYVDGIYYVLDPEGGFANVTYGDNKYSGNIIIPSEITVGESAYSVTNIRLYAFMDCSGLTSVTIPNSVTIIEDDAFLGCSSLTNITIPNSVTSIGSGAFYGCSSLTNITIPNSVTSIGSSAFFRCVFRSRE